MMAMADLFDKEIRPGDFVIHWTDQGGRMLTVAKVLDVRDRGKGMYAVLRSVKQGDTFAHGKPGWALDKTTRTEGDEKRMVHAGMGSIPSEAWRILDAVPVNIDLKTSRYPDLHGELI